MGKTTFAKEESITVTKLFLCNSSWRVHKYYTQISTIQGLQTIYLRQVPKDRYRILVILRTKTEQ